MGSEVFEKPEASSLLPGALAYLQGLKVSFFFLLSTYQLLCLLIAKSVWLQMLGVRRFEYVLPIGTWLTVVGEVSLPSLYSLLICLL